ncbi:MAG TPA: (d)CMP kinase, partial [Candidatus Limnocylindrales bacterium]|nr:(d)CMP kinase [Candidatus Limnocylindrales bacterium]
MTAQKKIKVAIDGPAGSGKSTVAQAIASRLDLKYLDTGAMYRAITLKLLREKTELSDLDAVDKVVAQTELFLDDSKHVYLDGEDVTAEIRQRHVNDMVSPVSALSV